MDKNGEPLVVYHGTGRIFTEFEAVQSSNDFPEAMYFSKSKNIANTYSGYKGNIFNLYLNIKNPYIVDAKNKDFNSYYDEMANGLNYSKANEYDGYIVKNIKDDWEQKNNYKSSTTFVTFNPNQIKSATDNVGAFDSANDDIRFQKQSAEEQQIIDHAKTNGTYSVEFVGNILGLGHNEGLSEEEKAHVVMDMNKRLGVSVTIAKAKDKNTSVKQSAKGWYDVKKGDVIINLDRHSDGEDIRRTILHEVVGHYGLRKLFGEEKYTIFCREVIGMLPSNLRERYLKIASLETKDKNKQIEIAGDEYLADLSEIGGDPTLWEKVVYWIKSVLRDVGISVHLSDSDIRAILYASQHRLEKMAFVGEAISSKQRLNDLREEADTKRYIEEEIDIRYKDIKSINDKFNNELQQQIKKTLPNNHVYKLGMPSDILRSAGIPNLPIELSASKLALKSNSEYVSKHPFELIDVENLPEAILNPMAVFDSKTKNGYSVILTELKSKGNNFVVVLQINSHPNGYRSNIEINDIRSIYPKDYVKDIVNWINRGDLLRYADKNKILNWVTQQRSNSAEVAIPTKDLVCATKVLQNFENTKLEEDIRYKKKTLAFISTQSTNLIAGENNSRAFQLQK